MAQQNKQPKKKTRKISPRAQMLIDQYGVPGMNKRLKQAETGAVKSRDAKDKNIARSQKLDSIEFNRNRIAALKRDQKIAAMQSKLDFKNVPHTEIDRNINYTDSVIPGMPPQANVTETVTAKKPKAPTRDELASSVAKLDREISRLASLKTASGEDFDTMSNEDKQYYQNINISKRAHIANLIAKKNQLTMQMSDNKKPVKPKVVTKTGPKTDPKQTIFENLANANPDSLTAELNKAGINTAKIDSSRAAEAKRLKDKNNPENFSRNKKTRFRRAWRARNAKELNSKDPKVSTPIRLMLQQLENWEKGNAPFPDTLKNEL
tara:strand:- start:8485 stop:9447 length:963 start_codon:yes stop_codon:yes gene_type:complete